MITALMWLADVLTAKMVQQKLSKRLFWNSLFSLKWRFCNETFTSRRIRLGNMTGHLNPPWCSNSKSWYVIQDKIYSKTDVKDLVARKTGSRLLIEKTYYITNNSRDVFVTYAWKTQTLVRVVCTNQVVITLTPSFYIMYQIHLSIGN